MSKASRQPRTAAIAAFLAVIGMAPVAADETRDSAAPVRSAAATIETGREVAGDPAARRLVLCLDGTWNSTFDETKTETGSFVLKPTNVLKVCRSVKTRDDAGTAQISYYLTGVGAVARYPGFSNATYALTDRYLGGVWGAGFESNVEAALTFLSQNFEAGDDVFVFGFSRGAATARGVTQFLGWAGGLPVKEDSYYLPLLFREFIRVRGDGNARAWVDEVNGKRTGEGRAPLHPFTRIPVTYLGVWDTVMALGSRFEATGVKNATANRSFYVDDQPAVDVQRTRQALAIDERRYDFRPEIWRSARPGQHMLQRWFPGVHSNVGGGYRNDGLANGALRWVLEGAEEAGLVLDAGFLDFYRPYPQDTLYDPDTWSAQLIDTLRFRRKAGVREVAGYPPEANLSVDPSAAVRMISDPAATTAGGRPAFPRMDGVAYRPDNLIQFLACDSAAQRMLDALTASLADDAQRDRFSALVATQREERCAPGA